MPRIIMISLMVLAGCTGCTVVCQNRVFPKLAWYWSDDAKAEREYSRQHKKEEKEYRKSSVITDLAEMARERDGTNFIGVFMGMIAEHGDHGSVMMFSATSGQLLRWIPYDEFNQVYVLKTKTEYPATEEAYRKSQQTNQIEKEK